MYLGIYDFDGDPVELLPAYDRMLAAFPESMILFHACVARDDGITIYDACPSQEAFERFSGGDDFRAGLEAVGLPFPAVRGVLVHSARGPNGLVIG